MGHRVLIVDDNRDSADSMALLLRLQGHETRALYDGAQLIDEALEFSPNLVLLDIGLPGMSGYDLAQALRAEPKLAQVRLAAMSGFARTEDRQRSAAAGFEHHFAKPVDIEALRAVLESLA